MFGTRKSAHIKQEALNASELALQLARDRRFRKRLASAIEHGSEAGRRTRSGLGLSGAVTRLATDRALLAELKKTRDSLQRAYRRIETKRRTHRLRNLTLAVGLVSLGALPQVRERVAKLASRGSQTQPHTLEDLTREELYERAQEADIAGRSEMSKDQLIAALRSANRS